MYIHKMLHTQIEDIYTYNGNNVNRCLAKNYNEYSTTGNIYIS